MEKKIDWEHVYVSDFGVRGWWLRYNRETEETLKMPGPLAYLAPEIFHKGSSEISTASDIWAVGCIGAELVTGSQLFATEQMLEAYIEREAVDSTQYTIIERDAEIFPILAGLLQRDRRRRWTIWDLQRELEKSARLFSAKRS
jgi:serine/threonine protein kinase